MKIVTVLGGPHDDGNTAAALGLVEERVAGAGHSVDRIRLSGLRFRGCQGCYECQKKTDEPGCAVRDDVPGALDRILAADAVVYATPLYMWGPAADLRAFLERHLCLVTGYGTKNLKSLVAGKRAALLVTCGGPKEENADLIEEMFARATDYFRADSIGTHVVPLCTTPDALPDAADLAARAIAERITRR